MWRVGEAVGLVVDEIVEEERVELVETEDDVDVTVGDVDVVVVPSKF
jgi:predicted transcriptional regulator